MNNLRVAYLLKKFPRLSETFVLNEILAQEELGADLHVFSRRPADDEPRHPELARLRATCEVLPSSKEIDPWSVLLGPEEESAGLLERVRDALAVHCHRVPGALFKLNDHIRERHSVRIHRNAVDVEVHKKGVPAGAL